MVHKTVFRKLRDIVQDDRKRYLYSYVFTSFVIGLPFTAFFTYVVFQIQQIGFVIGHGTSSPLCETSCIVPFGSSELDLNAVILYLNAMGFAISGFVTIFVAAFGDYWSRKSFFFILSMLVYGVLCIPGAWLDKFNKQTFNAFSGLYVAMSIVTFIITALLNAYLPFLMNMGTEIKESSTEPTEHNTPASDTGNLYHHKQEFGTRLSLFGFVANYVAGTLVLFLGVILSATLAFDRQQSAGLIITTAVGFATIFGCAIAHLTLPKLAPKAWPEGQRWWSILIMSLVNLIKDLFRQRTAALLLLGFTVYADTIFAMTSVVGQLFTQTVRPSTLEFSLYTLAGNLLCVAFSCVWFWCRKWQGMELRSWLVVGYALCLVVPFWGSIGISSHTAIGLKHRWEFYVALVVNNLANSIINPVFRVVYSESIPPKNEIQWWGFGVIISCATTWVPYVVLAPFQQATNNLRYPLLCCLVIFCVPLGLEVWHIRRGRQGPGTTIQSSSEVQEDTVESETRTTEEKSSVNQTTSCYGGCRRVKLPNSWQYR